MSDHEMRNHLRVAIRTTVKTLVDAHPTESLVGYALLTDDELSTLSHIAITREALAQSGERDLLFCPTDWPFAAEDAAFDAVNNELRALLTSGDPKAHVDRAIAILVDVLEECRAEGLFSPDVFLSVPSTDPGPHLDSLETDAVGRLNEPGLTTERERFLEKWT